MCKCDVFLHICSFAINIGTSPDELALHMNPRFDAHGDNRVVVCNSYQGGSWCQEFRPDGFPFNQGEEFKVGLKLILNNVLHLRSVE